MKPNLIAKIPPAVWNAKTWLQKQSPDQNGALPACWKPSLFLLASSARSSRAFRPKPQILCSLEGQHGLGGNVQALATGQDLRPSTRRASRDCSNSGAFSAPGNCADQGACKRAAASILRRSLVGSYTAGLIGTRFNGVLLAAHCY